MARSGVKLDPPWRMGHEGEWAIEVGAVGSFHWMWAIGGTEPFTTPEGALRVAVLDPSGPSGPRAWRFEGQVWLMRLDEWKWPTIRLGFGVDFEALVR